MKLFKTCLLLLVCLITAGFTARAQNADTLTRKTKSDSLYRIKDSDPSKRFVPKVKTNEKVYHPDSTHSPRKAWTRSAFIPGWGQVYNHQWFLVPLIYAGLGSLGYAIISNHQEYKRFLAVARFQELGYNSTQVDDLVKSSTLSANDPYLNDYKTYGSYPNATVVNAKDGYFRNEEISILSFVAVWGVNIVEAYIYGKLQHSFTMDNNFSLKVSGTTLNQPVYASNFNANFIPALKLTLTIK